MKKEKTIYIVLVLIILLIFWGKGIAENIAYLDDRISTLEDQIYFIERNINTLEDTVSYL